MSTSSTARRRTSAADRPAVNFNFDTWVDENPTEPFAVVMKGKRYLLEDPGLMDFRDLMRFEAAQRGEMGMDEAQKALMQLVRAEDREEFFASPIPGRALMHMLSGYATHFGLGAPGEAPALSH